MAQPVIQSSFNSGEWAPTLYGRVDMAKYHSGAGLLRNWFVDYRGGASTRPGTRYILQGYKSNRPIRLIPFQATFTVGYVLEFGDQYIRFYNNGAPVLETAKAITAATQANPCVITVPGNGWSAGDWIFVTGVVGMTELNGRYFRANAVVGNNVTLGDLNGAPINSSGWGAYISGGTASRIYTITSPYNADDLRLIKFAQNVAQLILCHPSYPPQVLTLISGNNWTLLPIVFGSTAQTPTLVSVNATTLLSGPVNYQYIVTSVDADGNESLPNTTGGNLNGYQDLRTTPGTISLVWAVAAGAVSYNVYKADPSYYIVPFTAPFGFIGNTTGTQFYDTNIAPDFSITPPRAFNPFQGSGVATVTVTNPGTYTSVPVVTFSGGSPTLAASGTAVLQVTGTPTVGAGGAGYAVGDRVSFTNGVVLVVASVSVGAVTAWQPITFPGSSPGAVTSGSTPANPVTQITSSGTGTGATANLTWGVGIVQIINTGAGYISVPSVSFSTGAATATATLQPVSNGYPAVPAFFQQRLFLGGANGAPQTFYLSQPGAYFNFNISDPVQPDDSITATIVSGQLNSIKSAIPQPGGLIVFTDKASFLVNGGQAGSAVAPDSIVANAQSYNGTSDVPPIVANYDVLYVQAKGSIVRDSSYNFYNNVYTGTDISVISSHLFYGYTVVEWAWAEEPFKLVWAIRDDGTLLSLTFVKEQEFVGWAHSDTEGLFKSVAVVTEMASTAVVDATYFVVERTINGNTVKYIERLAERNFPNGREDAWCVDAGVQYVGVPETEFSGGEHLAGELCVGLADGEPITPFVMPTSGVFTLPSASKVTVGLQFLPQLGTLPVDTGEPTIAGKPKKVPSVVIKVADSLGLTVGTNLNNQVVMQDLVVGQVSSMLTGQEDQVVTDLVTGEAMTNLDPTYTTTAQYYFEQPLPYPATILAVIPELTVGDTPK